MDSAGLISNMRAAPSALGAISAHTVDKARAKWSVCGGAFPFKRRGRSYTAAPIGMGCGTRRICVQAVDTSSRPKGATGKQPFVEPQWLFPSNNGANTQGASDGSNDAQESYSATTWSPSQTKDHNQSLALYYIVISTSKDDKSSFSEPNDAILLSMIGEDGNAIMHKIPGTEELVESWSLRFQRGAVDIITVAGPNLGRLAALWIAPEAGTWRLEKASVTIVPWSGKLDKNEGLQSRDLTSLVNSDVMKRMASMQNTKGIFHLFKSNEALLGKDAWLGAAELKPSVIQETSDVLDLQEKLSQLFPEQPRSSQRVAKLRDESMKEYENLKVSILGFSSLLVGAGTASLTALGRGDLAEGFAVGGVGGFLYLLLLQRTVDQLPSLTTADISTGKEGERSRQPVEIKEGGNRSEANSKEQGMSAGNVESPSPRSILPGTIDIGLQGRIALVAGVALVLGRLAGGGAVSTNSPPQLIAGVVGFLSSKVAVVLAALKPTSSPVDN